MNQPPRRVDQIMAGFADGDATSHAALIMRDALRGLGFASDIFAPEKHIMPAIRRECRCLAEYEAGPTDLLLHHYGILSDACDFFLAAPARKILVYHNITPAEYFRGYHQELADRLQRSRERLPEIAAHCHALWAVSVFNAAELRKLGFAGTRVFPLPFSTRGLEVPPDPATREKLRPPITTFLAVGRVAPNKRIEDLMRAFAVYHRELNPFSRLLVVGSHHSAPNYVTYLRALAHDLRVPNICLEGFVWPAALAAYYQAANLYVSTSEHEGYCLPLVEAMYKGIPVIARAVGGVPETMNGAGVLYEDVTTRQLAGLMDRVIRDRTLRDRVTASQTKRLHTLISRDIRAEIASLLNHSL